VTDIQGWTAPGWEGVRDAFRANFEEGSEVGAAFAAYHHGHRVVDLWGGVADPATGRPWAEDTLVLVFSTTKGVTAMGAHRLAEEGALDLDAPVATYWPAFAQAGKEHVTVSDLLAHRAGLAWVDGTMTIDQVLAWEPVVDALARQAPAWPPGTAHGYHATTYGWLVGEVIRRVTGRSPGTYLRDEIAGPLGATFHVGLPAELEPRVATLISPLDSLDPDQLGGLLDGPAAGGSVAPAGGPAGSAGPSEADDLAALLAAAAEYLAPDGPLTKALGAPGGALADQAVWNSPALHAAELPAANGIGDARSLAQLYSACVCATETAEGGAIRVLGADQLARALVPQTEGPDRVLLGLDLQWGLGFMLNRGVLTLAGMGGPRAFGHFGAGGSVGWADPDLELGTGYVMNKMSLGTTGDARSARLVQASLAAARSAG
jgi:CubicO group peptidase (beta-lactamase class C family)